MWPLQLNYIMSLGHLPPPSSPAPPISPPVSLPVPGHKSQRQIVITSEKRYVSTQSVKAVAAVDPTAIVEYYWLFYMYRK